MSAKTFSWVRFRALPSEIHLMLAGTLLTRGAYYMVWPFLAVLLYHQFHLSATYIGTLLALATVCGAISGVYTGWLSDRVGRLRLILCGTTLSALAFIVLCLSHHPLLYGVGIAGVSIGCALLESSCKALIGDRVKEKTSRELALYCRYYAINIGAAVGPLFGITVGLAARSSTFLATALVYFFYGILLWRMLRGSAAVSQSKESSNLLTPGFLATCAIMLRHRLFCLLLLCNTLAALVYANFDSSLVQYLTRSGVPEVVHMIAVLVAINALTIVLAQFPLLHLLQGYSTGTRLLLGMLLMLGAQCLFAFLPVTWFFGLAIATVILSLGELIVFPTFSVAVDHITPDAVRGSYFGAANLYSLGSALASLYGGLMLDHLGSRMLFLGLAGLCGLIILLQSSANMLQRVQEKEEVSTS